MLELLSLYNSIPGAQKLLFKSKIEVKNFKKGEFLLIDGEVQNKLYLVKNGILMMYFDTDKKYEIIDFAYLNRFCVDIDSFSNQTPSVYCIQCIGDCEIQLIDYEDLQNIFDTSSNVERAYRLLTERIIASLVKRQLNQRIMTIQQRFNLVVEKRPELFKLVPHKYIASYINIDATNFSKIYNLYSNRGKLLYE